MRKDFLIMSNFSLVEILSEPNSLTIVTSKTILKMSNYVLILSCFFSQNENQKFAVYWILHSFYICILILCCSWVLLGSIFLIISLTCSTEKSIHVKTDSLCVLNLADSWLLLTMIWQIWIKKVTLYLNFRYKFGSIRENCESNIAKLWLTWYIIKNPQNSYWLANDNVTYCDKG